MMLDAIIIADAGTESVSTTSAIRFNLNGKPATIQNINSYINKKTNTDNDELFSWSSSLKLNGIFLFSYLKQHGFDIELVNNYFIERTRFSDFMTRNPRAVIISTTFIMSKEHLRSLVADIRSVNPNIFIIVGGPFIHSSYLLLQKVQSNSEYLLASGNKDYLFLEIDQEPDVDLYIVSLRGEDILLEVLNDLRKGSNSSLPHNSAKLSGGSYIFSNRIDDVSNAEPMRIDWELLPDKVFQNGVVPMQASNGCPNKCLFCNYMKDPRTMHITPLDRIIDDMKVVARRGARYVWFVDDNFRLGKHDLNDVCKRMSAENINLRWMTFMRASTLVNIDPILLKEAGCVEVQLGLESGDKHILQLMNKQADPEMYAFVVEKLLRHGINCSCYFLFGYPGETDASAGRTIEFIKSIEFPNYDGVLTWSLFPFMLLPLSPIYENEYRQKFSLNGHWQNWEHKTMNFDQAKACAIKTFFELKHSGILYRGDNQDIYLAMQPSIRKAFVSYRHECSKLALQQNLDLQMMEKNMRAILCQ